MASIKRAWTSFSISSTAPRFETIPMRRQDAPGKYLTRERLQTFLERRFPNHPRLDFHIHIHESVFSFDAPEEVTEAELEQIME